MVCAEALLRCAYFETRDQKSIRDRVDGVGCGSEGPNKRRCTCSGGGGGGGVCVVGIMHASGL